MHVRGTTSCRGDSPGPVPDATVACRRGGAGRGAYIAYTHGMFLRSVVAPSVCAAFAISFQLFGCTSSTSVGDAADVPGALDSASSDAGTDVVIAPDTLSPTDVSMDTPASDVVADVAIDRPATDAVTDAPMADTAMCDPGATNCSGRCVNVQVHPQHCGACGNVCAGDQACVDGRCVATACDASRVACGTCCTDLVTNRASCGACGRTCGGYCVDGVCLTCPPGLVNCFSRCVDVQGSSTDCGACGRACGSGQVCDRGVCRDGTCPTGRAFCDGTCADTSTDPRNCGGCGRACPVGTVCSAGSCFAGCPAGQTACGAVCTNLGTDPRNCGMCGCGCLRGRVCVAGICS